MITNMTKIKVKNRDFGSVGYTIPDLNNLYRLFQPNEVKEIPFNELFKLSQVPGGDYIINNYLIIDNEEAIEALIGGVEPEYFYTEEEITDLMKNGTVDQFEDCLNFAPKGVLDLIKNLSVTLPLNDVAKRDLILRKLNFNVATAIELTKNDEKEETQAPTRKAAVPTSNRKAAPIVRKTVISDKKE